MSASIRGCHTLEFCQSLLRNAGLLPLAQMYGIFADHRLLTIWPRFLLLGIEVSMLFLYAAFV